MRRFIQRLLLVGVLTMVIGTAVVALPAHRAYAQTSDFRCTKNTFLGLKPWYYYMPLSVNGDTKRCTVNLELTCNPRTASEADCNGSDTAPRITQINKLWLIGIVLFEDLLRVAALLAVVFVMYGGVRYITSQGEPEHTKAALSTIINALIGLAIAIVGATVMSFVGKKLGG